jgi:hypothetical protein
VSISNQTRWVLAHGVENAPSTWCFGAEDGIRTRDPHLGKVMEFVCLGLAGPQRCGSVHPVSSPSTASVLVVERSTIEIAAVVIHAQELSMPLSLCEVSDASAIDLRAAQTAASRLLGPSSIGPLSSPTRRFRKENHLVFSSHLR